MLWSPTGVGGCYAEANDGGFRSELFNHGYALGSHNFHYVQFGYCQLNVSPMFCLCKRNGTVEETLMHRVVRL